jgi:ABC-2 type transport system ATP-binding protein
MTMIVSKSISFNYRRKMRLFDDLSLNIDSGIVGLLGKNGAGKSTLLKIFAGLLKPKIGELKINGYIPFERDPNYLVDIYMVPEEFVLPSITISHFVKAYKLFYPRFDEDKLNRIFDEFELQKSEYLHRLSHGQRKKFLIAFALASNCKILMLDEPTNGLDIPSKSLFRKILVSSVSEEQLILISTHQVKDVDTILDEIVVVEKGNLAFQQRMADVSQKYNFRTISNLNALENVLYHEKSPMGYRVIVPAIDSESAIDLELLFNAIINKSLNIN